nr:hypothetical protein [uncultured Actinoplanes sp.]
MTNIDQDYTNPRATSFSPISAPIAERGTNGGRVRGPLGELDMTELRHPTESSRFALALISVAFAVAVAVFVLVSLGEATMLMIVFLVIVVAVLLIWVAVQLWRVRLLGDAVLVRAETLPEVQGVLDTVRDRLEYTRRIDMFVVEKISKVLSADAAPITLTSFFGVHVLVAEGDALGDLARENDRKRLLFTLATYVGALKARYAQWWSPLFTAFQMTGLTTFVAPLVFPYYRATVYSGDRIAYACCGDLAVSLDAVYRSLVGPDVAEHLRADGLTSQALSVQRRRLLRFAQLLRPTPHATNRYLHLLAFVRQRTPDAFDSHRLALGATAQQAEPVLDALSRRRPHPNAPAFAVGLAALLLLGAILTGVTARNSPIAQSLAGIYSAANKTGETGTTDGSSSAPADTPSTGASAPPAERPAKSPVPLQPATVDASSSADSSRDDAGNVVTFVPQNVVDGDISTAWRVPGRGVGESLTFTFPRPVHLTAVGVVPGYAKIDANSGVNRFLQNRRVLQARLSFDDEAVDVRFADEPTVQQADVDVDTTVVEVTILASSPQTSRNFAAISEVTFDGWVIG